VLLETTERAQEMSPWVIQCYGRDKDRQVAPLANQCGDINTIDVYSFWLLGSGEEKKMH